MNGSCTDQLFLKLSSYGDIIIARNVGDPIVNSTGNLREDLPKCF